MLPVGLGEKGGIRVSHGLSVAPKIPALVIVAYTMAGPSDQSRDRTQKYDSCVLIAITSQQKMESWSLATSSHLPRAHLLSPSQN